MKLIMGIATLVVAILISCIAGYFSIVGLAALFAARAIPVIIMGSSLETGKLFAATWLKFNWKNKAVSKIHKGYLLVATVVLMSITSLGIYGFLAAGHLEQNAPLAGLDIQAQQFQTQLDQTNQSNTRITARLNQIDQNINAFLTAGSASKGLKASGALKTERDTLQKQMDANNAQINLLNTKLAPLKQQSTEVEAKLGPIKYMASAMGYKDPETAVNLVILLIMMAFDPLAVVLVLSAMITIEQARAEAKEAPDTFADDLLAQKGSLSADQAALLEEPKPFQEAIADLVELGVFDYPDDGDDEQRDHDLFKEITGQAVEDFLATNKAEIAAEIEISATGEIDRVPTEIAIAITPVISMNAVLESVADVAPEPAPIATPVVDEIIANANTNIRHKLLDMMEQYPAIVNDLLAAAKEMEAAKGQIEEDDK